MAKYRKIKRYSYRTRRQQRRSIFRWILFLLILAALVFVGYQVAHSWQILSERQEQEQQEQSSLPESSEVPVSSQPEESEPSSEPEPEPTSSEIRAAILPLESASSTESVAAFLDGLDPEVYNTVVITLKDQQGRLYYESGLHLAAKCGALTENPLDAKALAEQIEEAGFRSAALVYSLQDDYASHAMYSTSYMYENQTGVTWLDNSADQGGKSWLNPYLPNTLDYLSGIAGELSAAGFDDLFVFGTQYPNTANQRGMGFGDQGGVSQADALTRVLTDMQKAAGEDCRIIPAWQGDCYTEGTRPQVYTVSPNTFTLSPSAPIIGGDLSLLDAVTGDPDTLIPVISDEALIPQLAEQGIQQYLVQ